MCNRLLGLILYIRPPDFMSIFVLLVRVRRGDKLVETN
jgi:hypothetical protein